MERTEMREALQTAILLGEVAETSHKIEIDGIGEVQIEKGNAALLSKEGKWKKITRKNLDKRLQELLSESIESKVKRRIKTLVFNCVF